MLGHNSSSEVKNGSETQTGRKVKMTDTELAKLAGDQAGNPRLLADIANGSAIGIRPAPLAGTYEDRAPMALTPEPCDEPREPERWDGQQ